MGVKKEDLLSSPTKQIKEINGVPQEVLIEDANSISKEDKIIKLLEENLAISKELLFQGKRTIHWIYWQKVKGWFYVILIFAPLILAYLYLPPMLSDFYGQYQKLWRMITAAETGQENIQITPSQVQQIKSEQDTGNIK